MKKKTIPYKDWPEWKKEAHRIRARERSARLYRENPDERRRYGRERIRSRHASYVEGRSCSICGATTNLQAVGLNKAKQELGINKNLSLGNISKKIAPLVLSRITFICDSCSPAGSKNSGVPRVESKRRLAELKNNRDVQILSRRLQRGS